MIATTAPAGVVSHRRSLLVWPDLLDAADRVLLGTVLTTGARLLAFGRPLPAAVAAGVPGRRLQVWGSPTGRPGPVRPVGIGRPGPGEWAAVQDLHAAAGLVPLPVGARDDPVWTHARLVRPDGTLEATASAQALPRPPVPGSGPTLVCGVATHPRARGAGAASACVAALSAALGPAAAITEDVAAAAFFRRIDWVAAGHAWLHRWP